MKAYMPSLFTNFIQIDIKSFDNGNKMNELILTEKKIFLINQLINKKI